MVSKTVPKQPGAQQPDPKPAANAPRRGPRLSDLDVDQRRQVEEAIREREHNAAAWEHKTREKLEEEETKKLLESLKSEGELGEKHHQQNHDCDEHDPCGHRKPQVDIDELSEKVFDLLRSEMLVEFERDGWLN
jgi:hypothetical protein